MQAGNEVCDEYVRERPKYLKRFEDLFSQLLKHTIVNFSFNRRPLLQWDDRSLEVRKTFYRPWCCILWPHHAHRIYSLLTAAC